MDDAPLVPDFSRATTHAWEAGPEDDGVRLDAFLARRVEGLTRSAAQRLVRAGSVTVNGSAAKPAHRLRPGERVEATVPTWTPVDVLPEDLPLTVLHEEEEFLVVDKAAGVAVHPGAGRPDGTLANALAFHLDALSGHGGGHRPGIVHRLDMDTSGVLVVAKTDAAHAALADAFKERRVKKEYRALVFGAPGFERTTAEEPLGRDLRRPERRGVRFDEGGREASTEIEVLERFSEAALVACRPRTGRTHQIRVHARERGHPILGDAMYAGRRTPPVAVPRLMLHALRLEFPHPVAGGDVAFEAPIPTDFAGVLTQLRGV